MIDYSLWSAVVEEIERRFEGRYTADAICLSATHTHSAPGGFSSYFLYNLSILGHSKRVFNDLRDGIIEAIVVADASRQPGRITVSQGTVHEGGLNRSPEAHAHNADALAENTDTEMTQLAFHGEGDQLMGLLNWFAVHGTSHDSKNRLVSGDNKGYAAWATERALDDMVVAGFAQTSSGDVSPNRVDNGETLSGEGETTRESCRIIGERQARCALALLDSSTRTLSGTVTGRTLHADFPQQTIDPSFSSTGAPERLGPGMMGQNFMTGTRDGRGPAWFEDGEQAHVAPVALLAQLTCRVSAEERAPHGQKQPFWRLNRERTNLVPDVLPFQLIQIGDFTIAAVPFELTTMSGRRLRATMREQLGGDCVLACLSNAYAGYVATPEEYDAQYYEAASTLYGREQLNAVRQLLTTLAQPDRSPAPTNLRPRPAGPAPLSLRSLDRVHIDATPLSGTFGDLLRQSSEAMGPGEVIEARFRAAHPWNTPRGAPHTLIERLGANGWEIVEDDHDWSVTVQWERAGLWGLQCVVRWERPSDAAGGTYRITHLGCARGSDGRLTPYTGTSSEFTLPEVRAVTRKGLHFVHYGRHTPPPADARSLQRAATARGPHLP